MTRILLAALLTAVPWTAWSAPPLPPETLTRETDGAVTIRAVRVSAPLHIDGVFDEPLYREARPASEFIQMEPRGGTPATERTEVWLSYDQNHVYVSVKAWESAPERRVANEMRRDSGNIRQGDSVGFSFDTFRDRRSALLFEVNPLGGRTDGQSTNERQYNADWNPVWQLATGRFDGGWCVEVAIPFASLRYAPGTAQDWGFQARRTVKWKNEIAYLTTVPPAFGLGRGDFSASLYASVVGLEAPASARRMEVKPYVIGSRTDDRLAVPPLSSGSAAAGVDAKYAITPNLTADLTVNTDFAQVEADEQQVNLTRFSLYFPEKRDFFLENQGIFTFGNNATSAGSATSDVPVLFYSRRIGLANGRDIPIYGGGRVTGRAGRYSMGAVTMQTHGDAGAQVPATNFSVLRVKRDVLRRSSLGALGTYRSSTTVGTEGSGTYGVDGTFAFFSNLSITSYWAQTQAAGRGDHNESYRAQLDYAGDRYGIQAERLVVGRDFAPDIGFVRRSDMRKTYAQARFSPRPRGSRRVRKRSAVGQYTYIDDDARRLSTRTVDGELALEFQNSDRLSAGVTANYERVTRTFPLTATAAVAPGIYSFTTARAAYTVGQQRRASGTLLLERGEFYGGRRTSATISRARLNVTSRLSVEPSLSLNWIALPTQTLTTQLLGGRVTFTATPLLFVSALVQYNHAARTLSANARLRWEYRPGSELFVVWNEERDRRQSGWPNLQTRSLIVKANRFLRF